MEFEDRVSAYPNRYTLTDENGNASYVVLERADEPTKVGTPLNAETFNGLFGAFAPNGNNVTADKDEINAFRTNGWIRFYSGDESIRLIDVAMSHAVDIRADFFSTDYGMQTAYTVAGYVLQRSYHKKWLPWEWVNPPMTPGIEYRTIEHWNGHVVYTMLIDVGNLPNNSVKSMALSLGAKAIVEARGATSTGQFFPFNTTQISTEPIPGIDLYVNHDILAITTHSDKSERTAQVTIKYIKEG